MRTAVVFAVLLGLGLVWHPAPGWVVGCCKCTGCPPPPSTGVICTDELSGLGACDDYCEGCEGSSMFNEEGVCGVDAFAECNVAMPVAGAPAPALGWPGLAVAALLLAGVGFAHLVRQTGRRGTGAKPPRCPRGRSAAARPDPARPARQPSWLPADAP